MPRTRSNGSTSRAGGRSPPDASLLIVLVKIAAELNQALMRRAVYGTTGIPSARVLARGEGWSVADVLCTSGPSDRRFEEQHDEISIAIVAAGKVLYRTTTGHALMTPGSILLS